MQDAFLYSRKPLPRTRRFTETEQECFKIYICAYAYADGFVVRGMFRAMAVDATSRGRPRGNLSFVKELWLDGSLGVEPRMVRIALIESLCDIGVRWNASTTGDRLTLPRLNCTLKFAIQMRKSTEKPQSVGH